MFRPGIRYREENFGGILYANPSKWSGVTPELYRFFMQNNVKEFSLDTLAKALGLSKMEDIKRTVEILKRGNIIKEGGEKYGN
jgi:hypothetical protein